MNLSLSLVVAIGMLQAVRGGCADSGCVQFDPASGNCVSCNVFRGLALNPQLVCAPTSVPACARVSSTGACTACTSGFALSSGRCVVANCLLSDLSGMCALCGLLTCSVGRSCLPAQSLLNFSLLTGCNYYAPSGACLYCAPGFYTAANGHCVASVSNCLQQATAGCVSCAPDFFLQAQSGVCGGQNVWVALYTNTMYGSDAATTPVCLPGQVANCAQHATATTCTVCAPGYYLTTALQCAVPTTIVLYCARYSNATACAACEQGLYLSANACVPNPQTSAPASNCLYFVDATRCVFCQPTYYPLADGTCALVPTASRVANCVFYGAGAGCRMCENGFYLSGGRCATANPLCAAYASDRCVTCRADRYLVGGLCLPSLPIIGCAVQRRTTCLQCATGYRPKQVSPRKIECVPLGIRSDCLSYNTAGCAFLTTGNVTNCFLYNLDGTCGACATGFDPNGATCVPSGLLGSPTCKYKSMDGSCLVCPNSSQYYDSTALVCKDPTSVIPNCISRTATACTLCAAGFFLNSSGACVDLQLSRCTAYNADLTCRVCDNTTFANASGVCQSVTAPVANCATYDSATTCSACSLPFSLAANKTACTGLGFTLLANCRYQVDSDHCLLCQAGYYLATGPSSATCVKSSVVRFCDDYNGDGQCARCISGYTLSNPTTCVAATAPLVAGCTTYASATACAACDAGLYLANSTTCATVTTPLTGCLLYASATACAACDTAAGFAINPATSTCIAKCAVAGASGCAQCVAGFYPSGSGCAAVTTAVANCATYSSATVCAACAPGFTLQSTNTCTAGGDANCSSSARVRCLVCDKNYFASNGACTRVSTTITGCLVYAPGGTTCQVCQPNYSLNAQLKCSSNGSTISSLVRSLAGWWFD